MTAHTPSSPIPIGSGQTAESRSPASLNLAAVVLMCGSVRQSDLMRAAQRALLDLPITSSRTLGRCWLDRVNELRSALDQHDLPLIVAANGLAGAPRDASTWPSTTVCMDSEAARGSGGALRDAVRNLPDDSFVLVAPGHVYQRAELSPLLDAFFRVPADAVIHTDSSRVPSGMFLIRCGVLSDVPKNGFSDLKEQVLPQLAGRMDIRVLRHDVSMPLAIRSLEGYIRALKAVAEPEGQLPEDWRCTFAIAEPKADVHASARLHDSVVLNGGRVSADAIVVRSIVGPGGIVRPGEAIFDRIVSGDTP